MSRPLTAFERWLLRKTDDRRLISEIYSMILAHTTAPRTPGQVRWEIELGRPLTAKEWEQAHYRAHHTAHSTSGMETAFKVLAYWYYTPARVYAWKASRSDLCWRGCGATGTLTHLLWRCPKLVRYWAEVLNDIDSTFKITLPRTPETILLGLPQAKHYPLKSLRGRQIALALLAARQVLLAKWGTNTDPIHSDWIYRLWQLLAMEHLSLGVEGKGSTFQELWEPFLHIITKGMREVTCRKYLQVLKLVPLEPCTE